MESPRDSTAIIRMRKDFDAFLFDNGSRREQPSIRVNLDAEVFSSQKRLQQPRSTKDSARSVLEKEKEEKSKMVQLLAAQGKIAQLETQLASVTTSNKRARIDFEKDLNTVKYDRECEIDRSSELRYKLRQLTESEQLLKEELAESRQEWQAARLALEGKLRTAQRERSALGEELQKVKDDSWQQIMDLKQDSERYLKNLELNVLELEETKERLDSQDRKVQKLTEKVADFEQLEEKERALKNRVKELEEQLERQEEDACVTRALRADINKVPGLEKEVTRLRNENEYWSQQKQNALLLQEQLTSVQRKLEVAEKRCKDFTVLQVENEDLKGRLLRWEAMDTSGSRRPQSPSELTRRVVELQADQALSLEQKGQLQASVTSLELQLREAKEQQQKGQGEVKNLQLQIQKHADLVKRLRRKLLLVTKERDSYKSILDSYESEMTVTLPSNSRVKELQEVLEGFQQNNAELESKLEHVSELHNQASARCVKLEQQCQTVQPGSSASLKADLDKIGQLQERVVELEQELKQMSEQNKVLEMRMEQRHMQGDYDPTRTKVLHFSMNPAAVAGQRREQELENLKEENSRLAARVQLLEQAQGPVEDLTMQVEKQLETVPESKAIEDLKAQLAKEELRKQRLVEAFKKTSQEFREICYQLLGYKIDMPCTGQYRLSSMYSESPQDYLLFKQEQSGEIQMLETNFSERQQDKLETYLQHRDSIPALLSAITLDLFNQQTMNLG